MDKNQQTLLIHAFKYATFTLGAITVVILILALVRGESSNLTGRALNAQERGEIPRAFFEADRALGGFTAPADTHVIFTVPANTRILALTFLGGPDYSDKVRYWYYCFSGNEELNKTQHRRGRELYDGRLSISNAERKAQTTRPPSNMDLLGIKQSEDLENGAPDANEIIVFKGGETCYLMTSAPLPLGLDSDGDNLNNAFERNIGTNPDSPDSDGDGIPDGREVYFSKTSPTLYDSDGDNLSDGFEDKDQDGPSSGETSATLADTDRDGLCDGDGRGPGCPEPLSYPFRGEDLNMNGTLDAGESDPKNKDTDGDGIPDLDEKWDELQRKGLGNRQGS